MDQLNTICTAAETFLLAHIELAALFGGLSLLLFFGTLAAVPVFVIVIREEYFLHAEESTFGTMKERHPLMRLLLLLLKNLVGALFLLMGFVMLFIPGQGLLTLLIGTVLIDFPGKRGLELRLIRNRRISGAANWIRAKAGRNPIRLPQ
jgi:hypothetical protein